jgi:simple sugar transport system ATP-binding protein
MSLMRATAVGDHFAVLIPGALAASFRKREKSREEITVITQLTWIKNH